MVKIFDVIKNLLPKEEKIDNSRFYKALEEEQEKRVNNNDRLHTE